MEALLPVISSSAKFRTDEASLEFQILGNYISVSVLHLAYPPSLLKLCSIFGRQALLQEIWEAEGIDLHKRDRRSIPPYSAKYRSGQGHYLISGIDQPSIDLLSRYTSQVYL